MGNARTLDFMESLEDFGHKAGIFSYLRKYIYWKWSRSHDQHDDHTSR